MSHRRVWIHLMLYPGHTLPTAAAPILIGMGLAFHDGVFAFWPAVTAFLCSWLVHVGGVFVDVHELLRRYPGLGEHPELDEAVATGWLRLPVLRAVTVGWFVAALIPGIYLYWVVGPPALLLGAVGIAASAWYALGRRSMASLGLADAVFFFMFGIVATPATYYVQAVAHHARETLPASVFLVGLASAALVTNVLLIDDIRDVAFDERKGWRTTPVRFGLTTSRREHLALTVCAYTLPLLLAGLWGPWLLLPLVTLPFAHAIERRVQTPGPREALIPFTPRSAFLAMGYSLLSAVGLGLAR